jgi:hypothetical protein
MRVALRQCIDETGDQASPIFNDSWVQRMSEIVTYF